MGYEYIIFGIFVAVTLFLFAWMIIDEIIERRRFKVYKFRNGKWEKK